MEELLTLILYPFILNGLSCLKDHDTKRNQRILHSWPFHMKFMKRASARFINLI